MKTLLEYKSKPFPDFQVKLEFKLEDLWIGMRWKHDTKKNEQTDVWICLVPCFPIHIIKLHSM